jgi:hypothetical protein
MVKAIGTGVIEITNGINALSGTPGKTQIIAAGALISFGGLSIFAQSLNFISKTDLSAKVYFISKLIQCAITIALGFAFFPEKGFPPQESVHAWADASSFYMRGIAVSWLGVAVLALSGIALATYALKRLQTSR